MERFAAWLQDTIRKRGLTEADLARLSGLNSGTISNLINGQRNPGPPVCRALSKALELPQVEVFKIAGLISDTQDHNTNPKIRHIAAVLQGMNDETLEFVAEQIESVLIPYAKKVTGKGEGKIGRK